MSKKSPIWSSLCSASVTSGDDEEFGPNNECRATEVIVQDWSSEVVALFLEDSKLSRLALSCQELRDARLGEPSVVELSPFTVITVPVKFSCGTSSQQQSLSLTVEGLRQKGVECGERQGKEEGSVTGLVD